MDKYWWLGPYISDISSWSQEERSGRYYFLAAFFVPLALLGYAAIALAERLSPSVFQSKIDIGLGFLLIWWCAAKVSRPIAYRFWPKIVSAADEKAFARIKWTPRDQKKKYNRGVWVYTITSLVLGAGIYALRRSQYSQYEILLLPLLAVFFLALIFFRAGDIAKRAEERQRTQSTQE